MLWEQLGLKVKMAVFWNVAQCYISKDSHLHACHHANLKYHHRLKVFENRVLSRMFQPKTGVWRILHDELHNIYSGFTWLRIWTGGGLL
jgi:hypothetical protein